MQWHYIGHIERKNKKTHEGHVENVFIRQKFGDVIWKEINQDHWDIKYDRYPSESLERFVKVDVYATCKDPIKEMFFLLSKFSINSSFLFSFFSFRSAILNSTLIISFL